MRARKLETTATKAQRRDMNKLLAPRKLSAILHADAVGFSRLMEADEEQTHRRLSIALHTLITTIETHSGRVIKTAGDAVWQNSPALSTRSGPLSLCNAPLPKKIGTFPRIATCIPDRH